MEAANPGILSQSVHLLLDGPWCLWYVLHPHHGPMQYLPRQRMLFAGEDFLKKILSLATGVFWPASVIQIQIPKVK